MKTILKPTVHYMLCSHSYLLSPGCPFPKMKFCFYWTSPQHQPLLHTYITSIFCLCGSNCYDLGCAISARVDHVSSPLLYIRRSGIARSYSHSTLKFLRNLQAAFYIASFYMPTSNMLGLQLL